MTRELLRLHFGAVLALGEACVLSLGGRRLLLRVTGCNTLDAEAQEEAVGYHCYRGAGCARELHAAPAATPFCAAP